MKGKRWRIRREGRKEQDQVNGGRRERWCGGGELKRKEKIAGSGRMEEEGNDGS